MRECVAAFVVEGKNFARQAGAEPGVLIRNVWDILDTLSRTESRSLRRELREGHSESRRPKCGFCGG